MSKSAREIKLTEEYIQSEHCNIKTGAIEKRDFPDTVYIFCSFWVEPKTEYKSGNQEDLKQLLEAQLESIYKNEIKNLIRKSSVFPFFNENIFIVNIPDNLNYNEGRNFISLELYLHTKNLTKEEKLPLSQKKDTELFEAVLQVARIISDSSVMNSNSHFELHKCSK